MEQILYLECFSGISGDMTVGALLDLGADPEVLRNTLEGLNMEGYHIHIGRTKKCGIDACSFDVHLHEQEHSHKEDQEHIHSHEHYRQYSCKHGHEDTHLHNHTHGEEDGHTQDHGHDHIHRGIDEIFAMIDGLKASDRVKELSRKMFLIVAEAESKAHGIPVEQVHFHEVGAIDSIVDIISTAVCVENLGIEKVAVSSLYEGSGQIRCQHGIIPVPVPAVVNIAAAHGLTLRQTETEGEMVTPTGAAIAAAFQNTKLPTKYRVRKIGLGAGKKEFDHANVLRAMIVEPEEEASRDTMWVLETNIDDCSGEALGYTLEKLLEAGARDAFYTPVYMKKNRPAYMLKVICMEKEKEVMEDIIFAHTTTIGIRRYPVERTALQRRLDTVMTCYGEIGVKVCSRKGHTYVYPEYESIRSVCEKTGMEFQTVYQEAVHAFLEQGEGSEK